MKRRFISKMVNFYNSFRSFCIFYRGSFFYKLPRLFLLGLYFRKRRIEMCFNSAGLNERENSLVIGFFY